MSELLRRVQPLVGSVPECVLLNYLVSRRMLINMARNESLQAKPSGFSQEFCIPYCHFESHESKFMQATAIASIHPIGNITKDTARIIGLGSSTPE